MYVLGDPGTLPCPIHYACVSCVLQQQQQQQQPRRGSYEQPPPALPEPSQPRMSAKEKREFDKLELLKQARIQAFQVGRLARLGKAEDTKRALRAEGVRCQLVQT